MHITATPAGTPSPHDPDRLRLALIALSHHASDAIAKARHRNRDEAKVEAILRQFDQIKAQIRKLVFNWDMATSASLDDFRTPALANQVVRIRCQISDMEKPRMIEVADEDQQDLVGLLGNRPEDTQAGITKTLVTFLTLLGKKNQPELTLPFTDRQLIEQVAKDRQKLCTFEVMAVVVMVPVVISGVSESNAQEFRLLVVDIRPVKTALQLVSPTPGELAAVDKLRASVPKPMDHIMDRLATYLGIQGLDRLTHLREAIEFQVLDAATQGKRGNTFLIGPPGAGKGLVSKSARLLQPVAEETLPTKVTEAGLVGVGSGSGTKDPSRAGLLPMSDQGCFIVQDFHQTNSVKNQRLCSTLATVMEDGVVHDGSASRCSYRAETAIVIDANRQSDVRQQTVGRRVDPLKQLVDDTRMPLNLITRFGFVSEIPRSVLNQIDTLRDVLDASALNRQGIQEAMSDEMRLIRVWLARLRDVHETVSIPAEVAAHLSAVIQTAINVTRTRLEQHENYGDFMTRLAEQAKVLTMAHARLHNRSEATVADVDGIYPFLYRKMDFVRTLLFGSNTSEADVRSTSNGRQMMIQRRLKPGRYSAKAVKAKLCLSSCSEEAIAADLRALYGDEDGEGRYAVCA